MLLSPLCSAAHFPPPQNHQLPLPHLLPQASSPHPQNPAAAPAAGYHDCHFPLAPHPDPGLLGRALGHACKRISMSRERERERHRPKTIVFGTKKQRERILQDGALPACWARARRLSQPVIYARRMKPVPARQDPPPRLRPSPPFGDLFFDVAADGTYLAVWRGVL